MKKIIIFPLALALCLVFSLCAPAARALEEPKLTAQAVLLADVESGRVLYARNETARRSPASLTKVMTILLTLEAVERGEVRLDDVVVAGADCRSGMRDDSSSVGIAPGEELTLRDLLYCAAVASGNDACNVIASYLAGSIPGFVDRMNDRSAELGCSQTHFVDPHGLSYDNQTSAWDLFLITREAMKHPAFMELCDTAAYLVPETNLHKARELNSSNALISSDGIYGAGYLYEGAHGIKTGYTRAAGYCLISTARRDGMQLLAIVLGCDGPYLSDTQTRYHFVDTARLYDWAFASFRPRTLLTKEQVVDTVSIAEAAGGAAVSLCPRADLTVLMPADWDGSGQEVRVLLNRDALVAPIAAGDELGTAQVFVNGEELASVPLVAANDVPLCLWADFARQFFSILTENGSSA